MRVASIVGARPQFIKAAVVSRVLRKTHEEVLIHTGQHYDPNLSQVFFDVLGIPEPDVNLGVGSGPHGAQTGRMLEALEPVLSEARPDVVLVYGDTNSTLAGALAAVKLLQPVAHVEAGVRSFNRTMPEEINRILVDRISSRLFCPTAGAVQNLRNEGVTEGVHRVGDVMYDAALQNEALARRKHAHEAFGLEQGGYLLLTVHRASNADDVRRLGTILKAVATSDYRTLFPAHPRTREVLNREGLAKRLPESVQVVEPVDYLVFLSLLLDAAKVVTDSGGVQKEAYFFEIPCITLRGETEWEETLEGGWNVLADADPKRIQQAVESTPEGTPRRDQFGDGHAAEKIVATLEGLGS
ncbi:MAG: UDP-N-acetylglucosamine 2-epimerase (non-hydrolyzing) [candidate division NC10 bacterium]